MLVPALILISWVTLDTLLTFLITVIVRMKYNNRCSEGMGPFLFLRWEGDGKMWNGVDTSVEDTRIPSETKAKHLCRLQDSWGSHLQDYLSVT